MTVLSINERIIRAKKKISLYGVDFEVLRVSKSPAKVLNEMAAYVVSVMATRDDDEENPFDPLEFRVYNDDKENYLTDVLITCGGPNVSVFYDSIKDSAVISYHWGHDYLEVKTSDAPIVDIIREHSSY